MTNINEMQTKLEAVLEKSKLNQLFKLGKIKTQETKQPYFVNIRLKLHNPYTFTSFEIIEKKSGLKFSICHLKTMPKQMWLEILNLGGAQNNTCTRFDFPFEDAEKIAIEIYKICMNPKNVKLCSAQDYKPYKILAEQNEE